ncbi:hypothetical protein DFO74_1121 [Chromohalobacter israelensis]|nr:hypothetical protein DFO74_1121 [Chromohalobacter salexigens]
MSLHSLYSDGYHLTHAPVGPLKLSSVELTPSRAAQAIVQPSGGQDERRPPIKRWTVKRKARPQDTREQYESELREAKEALGEAHLQIYALKKFKRLLDEDENS